MEEQKTRVREFPPRWRDLIYFCSHAIEMFDADQYLDTNIKQ